MFLTITTGIAGWKKNVIVFIRNVNTREWIKNIPTMVDAEYVRQ